MANPDHFELLLEDVDLWNQWRMDNPEVIPDLSSVNLWGAELRNADFHKTNLRFASLNNADLTEANFIEADLTSARLAGATLQRATLNNANLSDADLERANLEGANLERANLIRAVLSEAKLSLADLRDTNLTGSALGAADLSEAKLNNANLREASLRVARLLYTNLDGATLTGASLWSAQFAGWSIKGVICEYVYWDEDESDKSFYNTGEFERLYAHKTKARLFYKDGINALEIATLPALIKHLEESHPGTGLRLVSIHEDSSGVVVELAVDGAGDQSAEQLKHFIADLETEAQQKAEYLRQALDDALQLRGQVQAYERVVGQLLSNQKTTYYLEKGGIKMGDTYNVSGQAGAVGHNAHAHDMTFNQVVNHFDLPALAKQLSELREEMATRQDSSPQAVIAQGEAAKAEMAAKEGNASKVVEYLKAGGQGLLDIAKETSKELLTAAIKASMGMQ